MILVFAVIIVGVLIIALLLVVKIKRNHLRFSDGTLLPAVPNAALLTGHAAQVVGGVVSRQLEAWADEFGSIFEMRLGPNPVLVSSDVVANHNIFARRPGACGTEIVWIYI